MIHALEGMRVVELGEGVSAAYCARLFADFGADVVKIEAPDGDLVRRWGPFPGDVPDPEKSGLFAYLNTNKRGVVLDMTRPEGRLALERLVAGADLLIENFHPARARALGLEWEDLERINPGLVMVSLTPFGPQRTVCRVEGP